MSKYSESSVDLNDPNSSLSKIVSQVKTDAKVLDVGCSSGYLGEVLIKTKGAKVSGIEIDAQDAKTAEGRGLKPVLVADIEQFDWSRLGSQKFDYIIFADVLEHLKDPAAVLRLAVKKLAAGGQFLVSVPNIAHASIRVELMEGNFIYENVGILDNTHTKYFTRQTIQRLFEEASLKVTRIEPVAYDLPDDLLEKRLAKLGLQPQAAFRKLLDSEEARAYQFVLAASPAGKGEIKTTELPPKLVMPHAQVTAELAELKAKQIEADKLVAEKNRQIAHLDKKLADIFSSKRWKLAEFLGRINRLGRK